MTDDLQDAADGASMRGERDKLLGVGLEDIVQESAETEGPRRAGLPQIRVPEGVALRESALDPVEKVFFQDGGFR
jgi:hypothetical protein